jgi:alkanesulfonate monooxygenase SsuD/methylene tetrahydromethanopterin reductase-like flavin-dependent oxidoreductase (luciferase family)
MGLVLHTGYEDVAPATLSLVAEHAERRGFDSLWAVERELLPHTAGARMASGDGPMSGDVMQLTRSIRALSVAARSTERITLGISLPNVPFYSPLAVARGLAAIDAVAPGRVRLGLGLGYSDTEFQLVSAALTRSDSPAAEFLQALQVIWEGRETSFQGDYFSIPRLSPDASTHRREQLPIALLAFAPAAVQRAAAMLHAAVPAGLTAAVSGMPAGVREVISATDMAVAMRAPVEPATQATGADRALFTGTPSQIRADLLAAQASGVAEIVLDLGRPATRDASQLLALVDELIDLMPAPVRAHAAVAPELATAA